MSIICDLCTSMSQFGVVGMPVLTAEPSLRQVLLYLDPGTGSLLFSVIVGIASTAYFVARDLLYRLGSRVRLLLSPRSVAALRGAGRREHALVLYSEGKQYIGTFAPLLAELKRRDLPCLYLSSEADDSLLTLGRNGHYPLLQTECIGEGAKAWARLRTLRANVVCMTTPGLDVLQIRRSPHVRHYMHIVHAPTDKSFNRPYSFDFFDSVLISGPHQERVIRRLEAVRGRHEKALYSIGCLYYDSLLPRYEAACERAALMPRVSGRRPTVLLAPTWGKNGLLSRYGFKLIEAIVGGGCTLIIRPHPQTARSEVTLLGALREQTAGLANCSWDFDDDATNSIAASDILVSDISGIVFDYAFLTGRPVLTMELDIDKRGFEAMDLDFEPWEIACLELIGRRVGLRDVSNLPTIILEESGRAARAEQIRQLRERDVLNFGCARAPAVEQIAQLAGLQPTAPMFKPSELGEAEGFMGASHGRA